ncbi:MAG: hypothetical protein EOM88_03400 [Clostridia bacterium]|nr:hypothetical protein [Clostridia bacterium]
MVFVNYLFHLSLNQGEPNDTIGKAVNFLRWLNYQQYDLSKFPELDKEISQTLSGLSGKDIDF